MHRAERAGTGTGPPQGGPISMQRWSPEIIRYLYTAADHSRYYQDLARQLGAFLRPEDRVCDAGCGLGL